MSMKELIYVILSSPALDTDDTYHRLIAYPISESEHKDSHLSQARNDEDGADDDDISLDTANPLRLEPCLEHLYHADSPDASQYYAAFNTQSDFVGLLEAQERHILNVKGHSRVGIAHWLPIRGRPVARKERKAQGPAKVPVASVAAAEVDKTTRPKSSLSSLSLSLSSSSSPSTLFSTLSSSTSAEAHVGRAL